MSGYLVLESGEIFEGLWHGETESAGEVVFNTSHSGYEEMATDPSYFKQIIVMTAPMMGNYGVDKKVWESEKIWIEGFVCLQMQNSVCEHSWRSQLIENKIPIISEIDTRWLTMRLRQGGTPWGALVHAYTESEAKEKATALIQKSKQLDSDWVHLASRKEIAFEKGEATKSDLHIVLYDYGSKQNIIRLLKKLCSQLTIVPARTSAEKVLQLKPDLVFLSNGPGDPAEAKQSIAEVKKLIGKMPMMGVCMGHQILSLALGAQTYKLKFGHRGSNHPIQDKVLNKVYVSSQNHGYAVDEKTLPKEVQVTHINLNDKTVAGIYDEKNKILGIQYHPESCPGPHEAQELFEYYIKNIVKKGI